MEKVFDTVDHNIFLDKIAIYGIKGTVYIAGWSRIYQIENSCVNGKLPSPSKMKTGIPQGSGQLGP
jgi:hypothetical protein